MMVRMDCDWVGHAKFVSGSGVLAVYQDDLVRLSPMKITAHWSVPADDPQSYGDDGMRPHGALAFWPAEFLIPEAYY